MAGPTLKWRPSKKRKRLKPNIPGTQNTPCSETKTFHRETDEPTKRAEKILNLTISATCNSRTFPVLWRPACISVIGSLRL